VQWPTEIIGVVEYLAIKVDLCVDKVMDGNNSQENYWTHTEKIHMTFYPVIFCYFVIKYKKSFNALSLHERYTLEDGMLI